MRKPHGRESAEGGHRSPQDVGTAGPRAVQDAVAALLDEYEPWQTGEVRERIRMALLERAQDRYEYPLIVATTSEAWALLTDLEKHVWFAVDDE